MGCSLRAIWSQRVVTSLSFSLTDRLSSWDSSIIGFKSPIRLGYDINLSIHRISSAFRQTIFDLLDRHRCSWGASIAFHPTIQVSFRVGLHLRQGSTGH